MGGWWILHGLLPTYGFKSKPPRVAGAIDFQLMGWGGGGDSFQDMKSEIWRETEGLNTLNPKLRPSVPRGRSFWWVMGVWYWRGWASEVGPRKADLRPCSSSVSADP